MERLPLELLDELCLDLLDLDFLDEDFLDDDFLPDDFLDDLCDCDAFLGFRAFDAETVSLDAGMSSHCCFYRAVSNVATISDEPLQHVSDALSCGTHPASSLDRC